MTTHKIDLYEACRDLFDREDEFARLMGEASSISKRGAALICHAKDPISSGLAIDSFLPPDHFARTGAEVFSIGAGGSTIALTWHLMRRERGANVPSRIVVSNRSAPRLAAIERVHREIDSKVPVEYVLAPTPSDNDAIVSALKPGSLVVNATGLGKDAPGSPISDAARFPEGAIAWDLNYRGDLVFLDQARRQVGRPPSPGRGRLDLFPPWLASGHRRGLRHPDRDVGPRVRRALGHRGPLGPWLNPEWITFSPPPDR